MIVLVELCIFPAQIINGGLHFYSFLKLMAFRSTRTEMQTLMRNMSLMKIENHKGNKDPKSFIFSWPRMDVLTKQECIS